MKLRANHQSGLSRLDVYFIIAAFVLLALTASLIVPAFARAKPRKRIPCTMNLKQLGLAYRLFEDDHNGRFPFALSNELGGSFQFRNSQFIFPHYVSMSNELVTPKVLVCPVDARAGIRIKADSFLGELSNSNISYFVGLDASTNNPAAVLSGDWNISGATSSNGCLRWFTSKTPAIWTTNVHRSCGNIGLADGSVLQTTSQTLQQQLQQSGLPVIRLAVP